MKTNILTKLEQKGIQWSGGNTVQLFIYPTEAEYQARIFDFRISTATVETEESDFTLLPNYSRMLMVLNGVVSLQFENEKPISLFPFGSISFEGAWNTKSFGKCTDFNLMYNSDFSGSIDTIVLNAGETVDFEIDNRIFYVGMYVYIGIIAIESSECNEELLQKDYISFENIEIKSTMKLTAKFDAKIIIAKVWKVTVN